MAQSSNQNYMDKIPVKISEKYKPPMKISLPQQIYQRMDSYDMKFEDYDFSLERNVLLKIQELKKIRERENEGRRDRIKKYEINRIRDIEEKQKQLLTAVSYPSTDDFTSDEETSVTATAASVPVTNSEKIQLTTPSSTVQFSPSHQNFNTILKPTIVPDTINNKDHLKKTLNNYSKINYSDFENDTSSPFDNIELKTINDLDILAQVLNISTQKYSNIAKDAIESSNVENNEILTLEFENKTSSNVNDNNKNLNNSPYSNIAKINDNIFNSSTNQYSMDYSTEPISNDTANNSFYSSYNKNIVPTMAKVTTPTLQKYDRLNQFTVADINHPHFLNLSTNRIYDNYIYNDPTNYRKHLNDQYQLSNTFNCINNTVENVNVDDYKTSYNAISSINNECSSNLCSRSKSVPDILRELNDEICNSEMKRKKKAVHRDLERCTEERDTQTVNSNLSKSFMKLSPSSQILAKNITSMGFPLERVCNIIEKFGNDDEKITEHLITLSELLDLGFEESKVSEALIKFNNDKEKALDFLIS